MASRGQLTGMRGVYLVASELAKRGFIASPTSRSAIGADILVTDQSCARTFSVQVKANASSFGFWLLSKKARKIVCRTHVYVLVNIRPRRAGESIEYFVVPSKIVADRMYNGAQWRQINLADIKTFRDAWHVFGEPAPRLTTPSIRTRHKRRAG